MGSFLDRIKNGIGSLPDDASEWLKRKSQDVLDRMDIPKGALNIIRRIGGGNVATDIVELSVWSMQEAEQLAKARPATNWTGKKKRKVAASLLVFELVSENLLPPRMSDAQAEELLQAMIDSAMDHEIGGHLQPPTEPANVTEPAVRSRGSRKGTAPPPPD